MSSLLLSIAFFLIVFALEKDVFEKALHANSNCIKIRRVKTSVVLCNPQD